MNIFITGCVGFIGSSLASALIKQGHFVVGIDNFDSYYPKEIKQKNLDELNAYSNFNFFYGDIRDSVFLDSLFDKYKIDVVIHLAAKAGVRTSFEIPKEYIDINVNGTINILEAMKSNHIKKLIFASSSSVYGNLSSQKFSEDTQNLIPISPYASSKKMAEDIIRIYSDNYHIQAICLRFFTVYGPKQRPDLAIHKFSDAIINNKPISLYGDGTTYRDYTYIDDITSGIISAIDYNKTPYEIINLGSGNPISLKDLVKILEDAIGKKAQIKYLPMQPGDVNKTHADIKKASLLIGYKPQTTFQDGLRKFLQYTFSWEK